MHLIHRAHIRFQLNFKQFYNFEALQNLYDISHVSDMLSAAVFVFSDIWYLI